MEADHPAPKPGELVELLKASPLAALVGQSFGSRAVAAGEWQSQFDLPQNEASPAATFYQTWLQSDEHSQASSSAKVDNWGRAIVLTPSAEALRPIPWAAVFTSSIDPLLKRVLRVPDRRPVLETFGGRLTFDPNHVPLYRLFGAAQADQSIGKVPTTRRELRPRRLAAADALSRNLSEVLGVDGRLLVEGWDPATDWLQPSDLALGIARLRRRQVCLFGATSDLLQILQRDNDFSAALEDGIVQVFEQSLVELLQDLADRGLLRDLIDRRITEAENVTVAVANKLHLQKSAQPHAESGADNTVHAIFSRTEWRDLNRSFTILQPLDLREELQETPEEKYRRFRMFVGDSADRRLSWVNEFAFERPVLTDRLLPELYKALAAPTPQERIIVVSGQSGSGKTTLLALAAVRLRLQAIPVVFIPRSVVPPNEPHLDRVAERIEASGSSTPLVVLWDGSRELEDYAGLSRYFASRGRRVLVVGTLYITEAGIHGTQTAPGTPARRARRGGKITVTEVRVDVQMGDAEQHDAVSHLLKFLPNQERVLSVAVRSGNFFSLLYRLLQPAQARLRDGLIEEIDRASDALSRAYKVSRAETPENRATLGALLRSLNIVVPDDDTATPPQLTVVESRSGRLLRAVMVTGNMGLPLPQSVALRVVGSDGDTQYEAYRRALDRIDVIRVRLGEDLISQSEGAWSVAAEYLLEPRQQLEAELWCRAKLDQQEQFEIVRELAMTLDSQEVIDYGSRALEFVIQLLRMIGPQGPDRHRMREHFGDIAQIVFALRGRHGRVHERLLLVGANATREWVRRQQNNLRERARGAKVAPAILRTEVESWLSQLGESRRLLQEAEAHLDEQAAELGGRDSRGARRLRATLATERAGLFGTEMYSRMELDELLGVSTDPSSAAELDSLVAKARAACDECLRLDQGSYHAIDTAIWIHLRRLKDPKLSEDRRASYISDCYQLLDEYEQLDLLPDQVGKLVDRKAEVAAVAGNLISLQPLAEKLIREGRQDVGHALSARIIEQTQSARQAKAYLEREATEPLKSDPKLLSLFYRLWWKSETGYDSFFPEDYLTLPFDDLKWTALAALAEQRQRAGAGGSDHLLLFHRGWSQMQLGRVREANEVFARLEEASDGSFRRGRVLSVLSHPSGDPRRYSGVVRDRLRGSRGHIWIDELRAEFPFSADEFRLRDTRPGFPVPELLLALNYRGCYAIPTGRLNAQTAK